MKGTNMKKISVIIPMYNSERFISQCLESVLGQTMEELEILVVDDGSADAGPQICRRMSLADSRIRLICQENQGVSSARNKGLSLASGEYVFFLDSDDVIHPRLLEEMYLLAEEEKADLVFCGYKRLTEEKIEKIPEGCDGKGTRPRRISAQGREAEKWFHGKYLSWLSGIGGKLMKREKIGSLRFDQSLANGEDTLFIYYFIRRQIHAVYIRKDWYYYRIHAGSVTQSRGMACRSSYFESSRRIRDEEFVRGSFDFALKWERLLAVQMQKNYQTLKETGDRQELKRLKAKGAEERQHPLYGRLLLSERVMFWLCFICYPLYCPVSRALPSLLKIKERFRMKKDDTQIGIITFHCSNNYGAMLQAYALRRFLYCHGRRADIVRFEPFYMTGRHWWIPYAPIKGLKGRIWGVFNMWNGLLAHLRTKEDFAAQRANMNYFRYKYLVDKRKPRIITEKGLEGLPYHYYIVGSDQIWNPDITCGLRKAYFGAFKNKKKEKVISYAASFGGAELNACHDERFAKLVSYVDAVSVREDAAVPYVQRFCEGKVTAVLDPVFFLKKEAWQRAERIPEKAREGRYIFLYVTEPNKTMSAYAEELKEETGLPVIEVRAGQQGTDAGFTVDYTAGPSEFLGYIHNAEYVVSNSFHAAAFSIIYEKKFLIFVHRSLGARVRNILKLHGLSEKLCGEGEIPDIHEPVDWEAVRQKTRENVKISGEFLLKNLNVRGQA